LPLTLVCHCFQIIFGNVWISVRVKKEKIDAIELLTIHLSGGGEFEHVIKGDRRMVGVGLFSNKSGPHGIVQFHGVDFWLLGY
jgi:hypothetical protein